MHLNRNKHLSKMNDFKVLGNLTLKIINFWY